MDKKTPFPPTDLKRRNYNIDKEEKIINSPSPLSTFHIKFS
jgi:hypothetical protein